MKTKFAEYPGDLSFLEMNFNSWLNLVKCVNEGVRFTNNDFVIILN